MNHDPQKNLIYAWEDSWWGWDRDIIYFDECAQFIRCASKLYKVRSPEVEYHISRELSFYDTEKCLISLQSGKGFNIPVSMHEMAHHLTWTFHSDMVHDHGPIFMGYYLNLLETFKVAPPAALRASLRAAHIRWVPQDPKAVQRLRSAPKSAGSVTVPDSR